MSTLKEQGFTLGFVGVIAVLVFGGWYFVWNPVVALDTNATRLSNKNDDVKEYAEQEEPLPTQKRGELATRRTEDATRKFREEALPAFEKRTEDFDRFFSNADRVPEASEFYSQYVDKIDGAQGLRKTYRAKYKLAEIDDEENEAKQIPTVDMIPSTDLEDGGEAKVRQRMKQVRIATAIFETLDELEVGGLKDLSFPAEDRRRRRRTTPDTRRDTAAAEPEKKDEVQASEIIAQVKVQMRHSKLQAFLAKLAERRDVPFLAPRSLSSSQPEDELKRFAKGIWVRDFPSMEAAKRPENDYDKVVVEPVVDFEMDLRVLDYQGIKWLPEPGEGDDDDDDDDR